jgi:four helix bundle protein
LRFQDLRVYRVAEQLADELWSIVRAWDSFSQNTVGSQLVRSADSIGANIAEGTGRKSFKDNQRFVRIARGSLYETQHWLRRAFTRKLLAEEDVKRVQDLLAQLGPLVNGYLRSIGRTNSGAPKDSGPRTEDNQ